MRTQRNVFDAGKPFLRFVCLVLVSSVCLPVSLANGVGATAPAMTAGEIVAAMVVRNQARAAALSGYVGRRIYSLEYTGFPSGRSARMVVEARYTAPSTKNFKVISETGSKLIIDRVLKRLLSTEEEAQSAKNQREVSLTPRNYRFELLGQEPSKRGPLYVLAVAPKVKNKFVYRGRVWIDASDFAVVRIEAEPAKNPSFWISHTHIDQEYAKFGSFWLPVENTSTSKIRMLGGLATLRIEYKGYMLDRSSAAAETSPSASSNAAKTF